MQTIKSLGDKLEQSLNELQFGEAIKIAGELLKQYEDQKEELFWDQTHIKHRLMIAETLYYRGQSESANTLLLPYVCALDTIKGKGSEASLKHKDVSQQSIAKFVETTCEMPMRWRLMPGEIFYSLRLLDKAKAFAKSLEEERRAKNERYEMGEIEFFRTRIAHREANYEDIGKHAMLGIAAFTESDGDGARSPLVQWRMGMLLLVFGTGAWRYGDPTRGAARLHVARWLLAQSADSLSVANSRHALGNMFRAKGEFAKAKEHLEQAKTIYEELRHTLCRAKIHTSLGIYWLNQKCLADAAREFESAMILADQTKSKRQQAEVNVWRSWLSQEHPNPNKIQQAISYGRDALTLLEAVKGEHYARVEAYIAVGSAYLANNDLPEAKTSFEAALEISTDHKLKKHMISVHLSMAELLCRQLKTKIAWDHYMTATTKIIPEGKEPDSKYLCNKRDRIKTELEKGKTFYLNLDQFILNPKSLKACQDALAAWLIEETQRYHNGNNTKTAEVLEIPRQRVSSHINRGNTRRRKRSTA